MNAWQVVCGEDVRRKEVAQCGNMVVLNVSEQMGSGGLFRVTAVSCCHFL